MLPHLLFKPLEAKIQTIKAENEKWDQVKS